MNKKDKSLTRKVKVSVFKTKQSKKQNKKRHEPVVMRMIQCLEDQLVCQ